MTVRVLDDPGMFQNVSEQDVLRHVQAQAKDLWRITPATMASELSQGRWKPAKHLVLISQIAASAIFNSLVHRQVSRIAVCIPPRHGKSELLSVHTPPWVFDWWPWAQVMLLGYASELATDFSRKARDFSVEHAGRLHFKVRDDMARVDLWGTTEGGVVRAQGVGGAITGRGAHVLLIDDYIKNYQEAASPAHRQHLSSWFQSTAFTRLEPGATAFIVATRWHPNDLIGELKEMPGSPWVVIRLPAIADEVPDPLGRVLGEALWPERYDTDSLENIKATITPYFWRGMYQQDPIISTSGMYGMCVPRIVPREQVDRSRMILLRAWDFAGSEKSSGNKADYTVGMLLGYNLDEDKTYILDVVRGQWAPGNQEVVLSLTAEMDTSATVQVPERQPGAAGKSFETHLIKDVWKDYTVDPEPITGAKTLRAQPAMAAAQRGDLVMVKATWNSILEDEILSFPDGAHDDCFDALSTGYNKLMRKLKRTGLTWGRRKESKGITPVYPIGHSNIGQRLTFGRKPR